MYVPDKYDEVKENAEIENFKKDLEMQKSKKVYY